MCDGPLRELVEARPGSAGTGQSLVQVDALGRNAKGSESLALGGEVLAGSAAPGTPNSGAYRVLSRWGYLCVTGSPDRLNESRHQGGRRNGARGVGVSGEGSPNGHPQDDHDPLGRM
jgi:hypothetical protein